MVNIFVNIGTQPKSSNRGSQHHRCRLCIGKRRKATATAMPPASGTVEEWILRKYQSQIIAALANDTYPPNIRSGRPIAHASTREISIQRLTANISAD
jgi:hypothetical protein